MRPVCYQVNLQPSVGGGEIYTRFLVSTLADLGWTTRLVVSRAAGFWEGLAVRGADLISVGGEDELERILPGDGRPVITHTALSSAAARRIAARHRLGGFVHMPLYERDPSGLREYHRLFGVSRHVVESARWRGHMHMDPDPMYGIADLDPRGKGSVGPIRRRSVFDWDRRKFRDRVLGLLEPVVSPLVRKDAYEPREGLTLGIVSRLTPIKQFPLLFSLIAPRIAGIARVNLEVFGAGGYATVRDLRRALAPLEGRVRFWGAQADVRAIYPRLDWVMSGLPEKEALGLNLIEAQTLGTPVLAVDAPPFTETVAAGRSGYLYTDPRLDGGSDFARVLEAICDGRYSRPDPRHAVDHLARFSAETFRRRVSGAMQALEEA